MNIRILKLTKTALLSPPIHPYPGRDVENDVITCRHVLESFDRFRPSGDGEAGDQ